MVDTGGAGTGPERVRPRGLPTGWPVAVPPPGAAGWEERASAWLFDLVPGEYRQYEVLRRYPALLARFASEQVAASLAAARQGWRTLRGDFPVGRVDSVLPPDAVAAAMAAYEREGARLVALEREVSLVRDALGGRRWVDRL